MKKGFILILSLVMLIGVSSSAYAHPGRLDKNGGHKCSAKSIKKGLCTGYHYHKKKK
nr:YHYH domain-containing protein [Paenibacillus xylanexedens]